MKNKRCCTDMLYIFMHKTWKIFIYYCYHSRCWEKHSAAVSWSKNTNSYIYKATFMSPRANIYLIIMVKYSSHGCKIIFTAATCKSACFLMFLLFYSLTVININIPTGTLSHRTFLGALSAVLCQCEVAPGPLWIYLPPRISAPFCLVYHYPF